MLNSPKNAVLSLLGTVQYGIFFLLRGSVILRLPPPDPLLRLFSE